MIKGEKALKVAFEWCGSDDIQEVTLTGLKECIYIKDVSFNETKKVQQILDNLSKATILWLKLMIQIKKFLEYYSKMGA